MKITSELCEWCNGSGSDSESNIYNGCPDCKGTGYKHGNKGKDLYNKKLNEELIRLESEIDWCEVERLEKLYENKSE